LEVITRSFLLELNGFYDRQRQGYSGVFLDRPAIERKRPNYVADLFRNIPGVEVVGGRIIMSQSSTFSGGGQGCAPAFWLDGIRSDRFSYDSIHPDQLEGAEVYTGGGAPMKYNDLCGTVVMWTRVPMRRR
jgi:outer membrane receptor protein involved in Fe transport